MDVESYEPKRKCYPPKCWIASLELTVLDKDVLLSPTGMLNDSLINAAQKVLKKQFPTVSGLQDVGLGSWMGFRYQAGEFAQVIHTTQDHWVTLSTIGIQKQACIKVFDSAYVCLPTMAKAQIANIMWSQQSRIEICVMDVQMQVQDV